MADVVETLRARRDLAAALDNVGWVAQARGDWAVADDAFQEALTICRELVDTVGTPQAYRDLAEVLDHAMHAAQAQGDSGTAGALNQEHEQITRLIEQQSEA